MGKVSGINWSGCLFGKLILVIWITSAASQATAATNNFIWTGGTCCGQNQPQYIHNPAALVSYFLTPGPNNSPSAYTTCTAPPTGLGQSCYVYAWSTYLPYTSTDVSISILSPADQSEIEIPNAVTYKADPGAGNSNVTISWTNTLEYQTSGGRGSYSDSDNFTTIDTTTNTKSYGNVGGKLTSNISAMINGDTLSDGPKVAFLLGFAIGNTIITAELISDYYGGTTPNLLTGIAMKESTYKQFKTRSLYGHSGLWPQEAYDGGSHIGLMQMPTTKAHAWDWLANAKDAAALFKSKLATAKRLERRIIAAHPGLPALSDTERENMALVLYGPGADPSLSAQYYAPIKTNGAWTWQPNTVGNALGVAYADDVRRKIQ